MSRATRRLRGGVRPEDRSSEVGHHPRTLLTVALQLSVAAASSAVGIAVLTLAGASNTGKQLVFGTVFGVVLPVSLIAGIRLAARLHKRSPEHLALGAGVASAGALAVILAARIAYALGGSATWTILIGAASWATILITLIVRGPDRRPVRAAWIAPFVALILVPVAVAAFLPPKLLRPGSLMLSVGCGGVALAVLAVSRRFRPPRWSRRGVDAAALLLVALFVTDVAAYVPHLPFDPHIVPGPHGNLTNSLDDLLLLVHHDFYLAPVNDLLHGRTPLVEVYSQYGVGVLYFLAAFFKVAPLGYGPLALLASGLTALEYAAGYAILRIAGCGRGLAILTTTAAIVASVFGAFGSFAYFPSEGALRFGLAYALILTLVAGARWPRHTRALRWTQLAILAVSSVWSIETFVCVASTFLAATAVSAAAAAGSWRLRTRQWAADLLHGGAACVAAGALLWVLTSVLAGSRPHLHPYLAFFTVYGGGEIGVSPTPAWAGGLAVGALYLASAAGITSTALWRPVGEQRAWLVAAAGTTAFGIVSFTYWVTLPNLTHLTLPAFMVSALWLERTLRSRALRPALRWGAVALAGWLGTLMVILFWPAVEQNWSRTAAWQVLPGRGPSLQHNLRILWHSPVLDPRSVEAGRLLGRYFPGRGPALLLLEPDLTVETLLRSRRVNRLPLADLLQDNLIRDYVLPRVMHTIDRIGFETPMLIQLHPDPNVWPGEQPTPLRDETLRLIRLRFDLKLVTTTPSGLSVVRLVPHGAAGASAV